MDKTKPNSKYVYSIEAIGRQLDQETSRLDTSLKHKAK